MFGIGKKDRSKKIAKLTYSRALETIWIQFEELRTGFRLSEDDVNRYEVLKYGIWCYYFAIQNCGMNLSAWSSVMGIIKELAWADTAVRLKGDKLLTKEEMKEIFRCIVLDMPKYLAVYDDAFNRGKVHSFDYSSNYFFVPMTEAFLEKYAKSELSKILLYMPNAPVGILLAQNQVAIMNLFR